MRFIESVVRTLLIAVLAGGLVWVLAPEAMAWLAASQLRGDVARLVMLSKRSVYLSECILEGEEVTDYPVAAYQLRFEDESSYVLEVVCRSVSKGRFTVDEAKLPFRVERVAGFSGVRVPVELDGAGDSRVSIGLWNRRWWVGYVGGKVSMGRVFGESRVEVGVVASNTCEGWGYQCCSRVSQRGEGARLSAGVLDCPGSCFESCPVIPAVTVFASDARLDENRVVRLEGPVARVTLSWSAQDVDGRVARILVDFGDGQTFESSLDRGSVSHDYKCSKDSCGFEALIVAVDDRGFESAVTRGSRLRVVVNN